MIDLILLQFVYYISLGFQANPRKNLVRTTKLRTEPAATEEWENIDISDGLYLFVEACVSKVTRFVVTRYKVCFDLI